MDGFDVETCHLDKHFGKLKNFSDILMFPRPNKDESNKDKK